MISRPHLSLLLISCLLLILQANYAIATISNEHIALNVIPDIIPPRPDSSLHFQSEFSSTLEVQLQNLKAGLIPRQACGSSLPIPCNGGCCPVNSICAAGGCCPTNRATCGGKYCLDVGQTCCTDAFFCAANYACQSDGFGNESCCLPGHDPCGTNQCCDPGTTCAVAGSQCQRTDLPRTSTTTATTVSSTTVTQASSRTTGRVTTTSSAPAGFSTSNSGPRPGAASTLRPQLAGDYVWKMVLVVTVSFCLLH